MAYLPYRCPDCHSHIAIITYWDEELNKRLVSHGVCVNCLRNVILPGFSVETVISMFSGNPGDVENTF